MGVLWLLALLFFIPLLCLLGVSFSRTMLWQPLSQTSLPRPFIMLGQQISC